MKTNEIENRKTIKKINETKTWFFEIYIIDKLLARLTNKKKKGTNYQYQKWEGFTGGAVVKNLPVNAGDTGLSPGPGRSHML